MCRGTHPLFMSPGRTFLFCMFVFIILVGLPVSADVFTPTLTKVYFEKDGIPVNESVSFTMNCYGYTCRGYDCREAAGPANATQNDSVVFSFSATCPSYGCSIYEPFYLNYRHIDRCDIEGELKGEKFTVRNFSETPVPDCEWISQFAMSNGTAYWGISRKTLDCYRKIDENASYREHTEQCNEQHLTPLENISELAAGEFFDMDDQGSSGWVMNENGNMVYVHRDPVQSSDSRSWIIRKNGSYWVRTPALRECLEPYEEQRSTEIQMCTATTTYVELDPATIERDPEGSPISRLCDLRVLIPSSQAEGETPENVTGSGAKGNTDPVSAFTCTVMKLFGGVC